MRKVFKCLFFLFILLFSTQAWGRATLGIYPVRLDLTPDKKIGEVTIRNRGENEVKAQVYAKTWDMDENGQYIEADTGDFVFFPRLLTIPGGEDKVLRVGYNGNFPPVEKPYRLYIQELPDIKDDQQGADQLETGVDFLLKLSVPIFILPSDVQEPVRASIAGVEAAPDGLKIKLRNEGIRNFLVQKINARLIGRDGSVIEEYEGENPQRILPRRSVFLSLPIENNGCDKAGKLLLKLYLYGSETALTQSIDLNPGCAMAADSVPFIVE